MGNKIIYAGYHKKVGTLDYLGKMMFLEKMFHTKGVGYQVTHYKMIGLTSNNLGNVTLVTLDFLNENNYFLLHVLVADLECFLKHYSKTFFDQVLFKI